MSDLHAAVQAEVAAYRADEAPDLAALYRRRRRHRRATALAAASVLVVTAGGVAALRARPDTHGARPVPPASHQNPATLLTCRTGPPFPASALRSPIGAERGATPGAAALRAFLRRAPEDPEFSYWKLPPRGWRQLAHTDTEALYIAGNRGAVLLFEAAEGGWTFAGAADGCKPTVAPPEGQGAAVWSPERPVGPGDRTFTATVWEFGCADGRSPEGRIEPPIVEYTPTEVIVTFFVRKAPGTCPGAPPAPYEVTLREPLGNRRLLDGQSYPPTEVRPGEDRMGKPG